jgi:hypothetical protein
VMTLFFWPWRNMWKMPPNSWWKSLDHLDTWMLAMCQASNSLIDSQKLIKRGLAIGFNLFCGNALSWYWHCIRLSHWPLSLFFLINCQLFHFSHVFFVLYVLHAYPLFLSICHLCFIVYCLHLFVFGKLFLIIF